MRPAGILLHELGFSRELDHTAISQTFVAEVANHNGAFLLSLVKHHRDELLYPMQSGFNPLDLGVSVLALFLKRAPAPHL
jgi:hypothetical protein